ncbi:MAG: hypothetical protein AABZ33_03555 [Chloroflexota bacterium]
MTNLRVLPVDGPAAPDELLGIADRDQLERGFRRLPPEQRAILVLDHYAGYAPSAESKGAPEIHDIMSGDMSDFVPFQVQLTRAQHRRLKALAAARGDSMGSMVRESVTDYLASIPAEEDPAFGVIGLIDDSLPEPHGDPAVHHDAYLAMTLEQEFDTKDLPAVPRRARPRP